MTAAALVADLRKRGVALAVAGDRLHWRAPKPWVAALFW